MKSMNTSGEVTKLPAGATTQLFTFISYLQYSLLPFQFLTIVSTNSFSVQTAGLLPLHNPLISALVYKTTTVSWPQTREGHSPRSSLLPKF